MNRAASLSAIVLSGLMLGACLSPMDGAGRASLAPAPTGVEGRWGSVGGPVAYTATFQGGSFTSTENATGAALANGSYRDLGQGRVSINFRSATTGQETAVNCNQTAASRMACVNSGGTRFELARA